MTQENKKQKLWKTLDGRTQINLAELRRRIAYRRGVHRRDVPPEDVYNEACDLERKRYLAKLTPRDERI